MNRAPWNPTFGDDCPTSGKVGTSSAFSAAADDPDGDKIYYFFDWGDGTDSGWLGPFESGEIAEASHTWNETGEYTVRVKARDIYGAESELTGMEVKISEDKSDSEMSTATKAALISVAVLVPMAAVAIFMIFRRRREDTEEEEEWEE